MNKIVYLVNINLSELEIYIGEEKPIGFANASEFDNEQELGEFCFRYWNKCYIIKNPHESETLIKLQDVQNAYYE